MRLHRSTRLSAAWLPFLLLPHLTTAYTLDCSNILQDGYTWHLDKLGGPHSVMWSRETPPVWRNTTFTLDICSNLKKKEGECNSGTRVCGIERTISEDGTSMITEIIPIAGDLEDYHMGPLEPKFTRLKSSTSHKDTETEGVRIELHGGIYNNKRKQRAIIDFICPVEGKAPDPESEQTPDRKKQKRDEADEGLKFKSYKTEESDYDTLFLEWETEYACESIKEVKAHWGFFTWFLIIVFLATAAYLIFGSWLNYNRYGARGWDLLPHGDTIRDVPYLLKDWTRRVLSTVQGGGSRGGYSAV